MHLTKTNVAAERRTVYHHRAPAGAATLRPAFPLSPSELRRIVAELLG